MLVKAQGGEEKAKYGNGLIKGYSKRLTNELGKGYNVTSLKRMRQFYLMIEKGAPLAHQLTWSHYILLLPIKDIYELKYYIFITVSSLLSKRELSEKIKNKEYERIGYKEELKEPKVSSLIKNPIIIKGNSLAEISENTLKQLILENLDEFLKELGIGFTYMGNEIKIKMGDNYNYIDILLFNVKYNCYIVVELKTTEFKAEHIGQITKYINYVDKHIKESFNETTIGIIICKKENKFVLEYVTDSRIFTTTYKLKHKKSVTA